MSFGEKISQYEGRRATIQSGNDPLHPPFLCGDFCGDSKNISHQLGASRRMQRQDGKYFRFKTFWAKVMSAENLTAGIEKFLLISGLQVRFLPGSPGFFTSDFC